ncbi:MAG: hypothetical protein Q9227_006395 [Pyrenula ochraceoflavens]
MATQQDPPKQLPKRNPVFQMLGMPNFRFKLPSRNWMIFLSITGSFAAAITYDRRQKKKAQQKWCDAVSHLALEPLPVNQLRRKLTVYLESPPGDSLGVSRQYFRDYVKPILVAAALDYEVIEGRKEGEVRYGTAEKIRRLRRKAEGLPVTPGDNETDQEHFVEELREKAGIIPEAGIRGDVVVGRHAWKEYIRGLHEGWLGPLHDPHKQTRQASKKTTTSEDSPPSPHKVSAMTDSVEAPQANTQTADNESGEAVPTNEPLSVEAPSVEGLEEKAANETKSPSPPPPYLYTQEYAAAHPSSTLPETLGPTASIPQPHILGFLNTPVRIYRFLNQRYLADDIGRQAAAVALGVCESYNTDFGSNAHIGIDPVSSSPQPEDQTSFEQQELLREEEKEWHKSVRKPKDNESERVWLDEVVIDSRIGERMRKFTIHLDLQPPVSSSN